MLHYPSCSWNWMIVLCFWKHLFLGAFAFASSFPGGTYFSQILHRFSCNKQFVMICLITSWSSRNEQEQMLCTYNMYIFVGSGLYFNLKKDFYKYSQQQSFAVFTLLCNFYFIIFTVKFSLQRIQFILMQLNRNSSVFFNSSSTKTFAVSRCDTVSIFPKDET